MARRKKTARRRRFTGINVTDAALGYAGVSIWTQALLNVDPVQFFMDKEGGGSSLKITARELLAVVTGGDQGVWGGHVTSGLLEDNTALEVIKMNASQNMGDAIIKSAGLAIGGAIGKKVTRKPRAFLNKQIRNFGFGDMIRF